MCTEVNHFKIFMDKLYTVYSSSPKSRRALAACAAEVGIELHKIGRVLDTRWVASSYRAVKAVWDNYAALHAHFTKAMDDESFDSKERAQFRGLSQVLGGRAFVANLSTMCDALDELSTLSESLQCDNISLPRAQRLIQRKIEVFMNGTHSDAAYVKEASAAVASGTFQGVKITMETVKSQRN